MLQGRTRRASFVFVNDNRFPTPIVLENNQTFSIRPENVFNLSLSQLGHAQAMFRAFDDNLVRADSAQSNARRFGWYRDFPHNGQSRIFIGDYSDSPTGRIGWSRWIAIGENFRWGVPFPAGAERTGFVSAGLCPCSVSMRTFASFSGDDHPAVDNWVFS
jgi:hypothetical protein